MKDSKKAALVRLTRARNKLYRMSVIAEDVMIALSVIVDESGNVHKVIDALRKAKGDVYGLALRLQRVLDAGDYELDSVASAALKKGRSK